MKNSDININIQPNNKTSEKKEPIYVQATKWIVKTISEAKWTKILKVYFVTFFFLATGLAGFFTYNIVKNEEFLTKTAEKIADGSTEEEDIRDFVVTPKVQHLLGVLLYGLDADRVFIFELHNGKKNISGLPFRYADMSYEFANIEKGVDRCYRKYQDVPLNMYTYPNYMYKHKFFIGTSDDIEKIDYEFAKQLKEDGGEYVAMVFINGIEEPLGFLGVSFHKSKNLPSDSVIEGKIKECGGKLSELLDLKAQIKEKVKYEKHY